jgi:hypothetical protein
MLLELELALHHLAGGAGHAFYFLAGSGIERLAVGLYEVGFVVKCVRLTNSPIHEELNDALGLGRMMQSAIQFGTGSGDIGEQAAFAQELRERDAAQSAAKLPQEFSSRRHRSIHKEEFTRVEQ